MKPEWVALVVNICCCAYYVIHRAELGKILYWMGASLLTAGLLKMKG